MNIKNIMLSLVVLTCSGTISSVALAETATQPKGCKGFFPCLKQLPSFLGNGIVDVWNDDATSEALMISANTFIITLTGGAGKKLAIKTGNPALDHSINYAFDVKWEVTKGVPSKVFAKTPVQGILIDNLVDYVGPKIRGDNEKDIQQILDVVSKIKDRMEFVTNGYNDIVISKSSVDAFINAVNSAYKEHKRDQEKKIQSNNQLINYTSSINQNGTSHFGAAQTIFRPNVQNVRQTLQENPYLAKGTAIIEAPADIVLNWGNRPADLDSHLTGPLNAHSQERFHVNFKAKGNLNSSPNVLLYRDDTAHGAGTPNRPEQTRINVTQPGVYHFYVHDYSNKGKMNSQALSQSGARVSVHTAGNRSLPEGDNLGRKVTEFNVPKDKIGTVWHTFELDTRRNIIKPVDKFHNSEDVIK